MESYKELKIDELSNKLRNDFPIKELVLGELLFGGVIPLVFVSFKTLSDLNENWKNFNSQITSDIIINFREEYSRWNFYVFFFSVDAVPKSLKYEIENNKFSSRKIVIDNCKSITEDIIEEVITEHITNDNIEINVEIKKTSTFNKNDKIAKVLDKVSLGKRNDDDLQAALDLLEKTYKNEI